MTGEHRGGYTRFSFDITDYAVAGDNRITVAAFDGFDTTQPRGKQRWQEKSFGCMYTPTSGIWKTVWLEFRDRRHIARVKTTPSLQKNNVTFCFETVDADGLMLGAEIRCGGETVACLRTAVCNGPNAVTVDLRRACFQDETIFWDPEHPALYDAVFTLSNGEEIIDRVGSYFGLRDFEILDGTVTLNTWAYYQKLVLYQGYWPASGLTAPDEDALYRDLAAVKRMGYNGVRCHQKIEDERFYYYADLLGLAVWAEMPSPHSYCDRTVKRFTEEWTEIVRDYYNHPSILVWVPFNESWGIANVGSDSAQQQFTVAVCRLTKALDGTRPVISNDGWEHTESDIVTLHYYEQNADDFWRMLCDLGAVMARKPGGYPHKPTFARGYRYSGQPVIFSEYGGCAFRDDLAEGWGYGESIADDEAFFERFESLTDTLKKLPLAGYCYTQLTDVEQEKNGIMTADRKFKVDPDRVRAINDKMIYPEKTRSVSDKNGVGGQESRRSRNAGGIRNMFKITFIGAGSTVFAKNLLGDCILTPSLGEFDAALYDIDRVRKIPA